VKRDLVVAGRNRDSFFSRYQGKESKEMSSMNLNEPIFDVAQLAHVEVLTPALEGTLWFFKDLLRRPSDGASPSTSAVMKSNTIIR
jgi:hypothetical protein